MVQTTFGLNNFYLKIGHFNGFQWLLMAKLGETYENGAKITIKLNGSYLDLEGLNFPKQNVLQENDENYYLN